MCFLFLFLNLSDIIFLVIGMSKKNKVKKVSNYSSDSEEMYRMLKVLAIVVIALVAFYFIFAISRGEISFGNKDEDKEVEIQNKEILAGNIFSKSESEYYVLMYDFSKNDSITYNNIYDLYNNYNGANKIYLVDLSRQFNSGYVVEDKSKVNVSSIDSLKVVNGTLIKVKEGKGVSYSVGIDDIKKTLFEK
jgi:hypothetical protein